MGIFFAYLLCTTFMDKNFLIFLISPNILEFLELVHQIRGSFRCMERWPMQNHRAIISVESEKLIFKIKYENLNHKQGNI